MRHLPFQPCSLANPTTRDLEGRRVLIGKVQSIFNMWKSVDKQKIGRFKVVAKEKRGSGAKGFFSRWTVNDFTLVWAALKPFSWTRQQHKAVTSHWFHLSHLQFAASLVFCYFHLHVSVEMFGLNHLSCYNHFLSGSWKKQQYITREEPTLELVRFMTCQQCDFSYYECLASMFTWTSIVPKKERWKQFKVFWRKFSQENYKNKSHQVFEREI